MDPMLASLVAVIVLLTSRVIGLAADATTLGQMAMPPTSMVDWVGWVEKAGTVGVCIWMLVWFQRRNDTQHAELAKITERAIQALEHNAESDRELADAVRGLGEVVDGANRR